MSIVITFRNIQVRIVLVGEVCLQSPHGGSLVSIADADELVRVAPAPSGLPDYLAKLAELLSYLTEGADVQVEKRYAEGNKDWINFGRC